MADKTPGSGVPLPGLIYGPRAGKAWPVTYCPAQKAHVGLTDKGQGLWVPERMLYEDWLVQQHELTHVADTLVCWPMPRDRHTRRFFLMLCEIAVEAISLHFNGVDIRHARDHMDWTHYTLPDAGDVTQCAHLWLQLTYSQDTARHPAIPAIYGRMSDALSAEYVSLLCQARDGVIAALGTAGDRESRLRWAAWLAEIFPRAATTPKPPPRPGPQPQPQPQPKLGDDDSESGNGASDDTVPGNSESESDDSTGSDSTGDSESESESEPEPEPGDSESESESESDDSTGDSESDDSWNDTDDSASSDDSDDPLAPLQERPQAARQRDTLSQEQAEQERQARDALLDTCAFDPNAESASYGRDGARIEIHRHTCARTARRMPGIGAIRAHSDGMVLKFPSRLWSDGKVMARAGALGSGILVDGSGSMRWDQASAEAACRLFPGLWVGWYSWHRGCLPGWAATPRDNYGNPTAASWARIRASAHYWARLCIVAERGRVGMFDPTDDTEQGHSGGNHCDAEVLEYFARTVRGRRVWVSDGWVLGEPDHVRRCNDVMARAHIVRVATVADAVAYLEGKRGVETFTTAVR